MERTRARTSRALQDIHDIISVEPVQPRDKVMMGMLATIGIEPGSKERRCVGAIPGYRTLQEWFARRG